MTKPTDTNDADTSPHARADETQNEKEPAVDGFERAPKITDPSQLKALAHPARIAVFEYLANQKALGNPGATATEISTFAGVSPSSMSYHLRTLATAGFIEQAPSRGDSRERVWALARSSFAVSTDREAPIAEKLSSMAAVTSMMEQSKNTFLRYAERRLSPEISKVVANSGLSNSSRMILTPTEADELSAELGKIVTKFMTITDEHRADESFSAGDGTEATTGKPLLYHCNFAVYPEL